MNRPLSLKPPFFEFGPKAYLYGPAMWELARAIDESALRHDVDVILTVGYTDIRPVAGCTRRVNVFAPHMDPLPIGAGSGAVLPEAIQDAGAVGAQLNHAEKPLSRRVLEQTIRRAKDIGLATMVCADTLEDVKKIAALGPTVLVAEPSELIGTGRTSDADYVRETLAAVRAIDPDVMVLQAAGISNGHDVYEVLRRGAQGTGCSSGIARAADPAAMADEMIASVRRAWDEAQNEQP
jgi:triosephosphate isomerase (TIM)